MRAKLLRKIGGRAALLRSTRRRVAGALTGSPREVHFQAAARRELMVAVVPCAQVSSRLVTTVERLEAVRVAGAKT